MVRILVADDHPSVRRGVKEMLIDTFSDVEIEEAATSPEVLELAGKHPWSLIILDLTMPGRGGLDTLQDLKSAYPDMPVLVLSMHPEDQFAVRAIRAGASGYITKESVAEELILAVKRILAGRRYIRSSVADLLATQLQDRDVSLPLHSRLSDRELQVLTLLARGKMVTTIADELSLSPKSISTYKTRILEKLNLQSTADIIRYAIEHHLGE